MANTVLAVTVQALVTYWLLLGAEQAVHVLAEFTADVYVLPAAQALHVPLVPVEVALPAT